MGLHGVGVALGISRIVWAVRYALVAVCRKKIVGDLPCGGVVVWRLQCRWVAL